jgi:regulator of sigma E protease
VENVVAAVEPGGPAEQAGLQAGDEITTAEFCVPTEKRREEIVKLVERDVFAPLEFTAQRPGWPFLMASLQIAAPDMRVKLTYRRQGAERSATVEPVDSERWHAGSRGLRLASLNQVRTADSWGEAFSLGLRETREKALEVVVILKRLVTGQTSAKNLGGPGTIFVVAASEASRGIPRLLMFLTLLSANLAVLNFLPIPALDGGHMVFLGAEWVRGKPVDEKLQVTLTLIGIGCLLSLMVLVCYFDIDRFLLR